MGRGEGEGGSGERGSHGRGKGTETQKEGGRGGQGEKGDMGVAGRGVEARRGAAQGKEWTGPGRGGEGTDARERWGGGGGTP